MHSETSAAEATEGGVTLLSFADLESVYDTPEKVGRLAGLIAERRDESTVVAGVGDNTALGTLAVLGDEQRAAAAPFLEHVQPTVDTLGNHDLDLGPEWVGQWVDRAPQTYICANIEGLPVDLPDGVVVERAGRRIGFVGVAHPDGISGGAKPLSFENPVSAVRRTARKLEPYDHLVVCSHWGEDEPIARQTSADVILGGHVHSRWSRRVADTLLVSPAGQGRELAEVTLEEGPEATIHSVEAGSLAAPAAAPYRERREQLGADEVLTTVDEPIERTEITRYGRESRLGNFAADAIRVAAASDLALFPAGSVREGPALRGAVTLGDIVSLSPFKGDLRELAVDGSVLRATLEAAAAPHPGERGWVHFHVSGARVRWGPDEALEQVRVDGDQLDEDATYHVATTAYVVDTDHFEFLQPEMQSESHGPALDALIAHARHGGLNAAMTEGRIRKANAPAPERG
jgi:2',3'-cyclic-nucleotide 2'-phosphodiesterase (5'-nucleotidase family)